MIRKILLLIALPILLVQSNAFSTPIYDNGDSNTTGGRNIYSFLPADDFSFASTTSISGAEISLASSISEQQWNDGGLNTAYNYFVFADNGGVPGVLLDSGSTQNTAVTTSAISTGLQYGLSLNFDFQSPFLASANSTFWLGLQTPTATSTYWAHTDSVTGNFGHQANPPGLPNPIWVNRGTDYSFKLTSSPVPESGATLALFGLALAGIGFGRRFFG